jgi:peroxiredoxin
MYKMKLFSKILLISWLGLGFACKGTSDKNPSKVDPETETMIEGSLSTCQADSMRLFELDGISLMPSKAVAINNEDGQARFSLAAGKLEPGFYFLGPAAQSVKMIVINHDPKITLEGNCQDFKQAKVTEGKTHLEFEKVNSMLESDLQRFNQLINRYRQAMGQGLDLAGITQEMVALDKEKVALLDSLEKANPFMAKYAGTRTYLSYQHYTQTAEQVTYSNEPEYFAKEYFRYTDLSDPLMNRIPFLHDNFKAYATTLASLGFQPEQKKAYGDGLLAQIPDSSSAQKLALLGLTAGFKGSDNASYVYFGDQYITQFPDDNPQIVGNMRKELASMRSRVPGAAAPEISLPNPEGEVIKLSELQGKVVLIDFWASWCGPCRRENPNVVKVYDKYKDKGFEILGVSLDRSKDRWVKAIEQDGLEWLHVSDLKFWQSVAAKTYGVSSIPYTVLVDREGKIIASRLRGPSLEAKLAEIFGE